MADSKLSRRDLLIGGASALVAPRLARAFKPGSPFYQTQKGWIPISTTGSVGGRSGMMCREVGNFIFMYGGTSASGVYQSTSAWLNPTTNSWQVITPSSGTAPTGRTNTVVAWNGSVFFVWGGTNGSRLANGGFYTPSAIGANGGTWTTASTTNAPTLREYCSIVAVGSKFIVWGGRNSTTQYNDGGIFDPIANSWTPIPAPSNVTISVRYNHSAIATADNRMILFGGLSGSTTQEDAFIFDLGSQTWAAIANSPYYGSGWGQSCAFCWIGDRAYIYGGGAQIGLTYNPTTSSWGTVSGTNGPIAGGFNQAFWTGSKVVMADAQTNKGVWDPVSNSWTSLPAGNAPNSAWTGYCVAYSNHRLVYWGGVNGTTRQNSGRMYYHPAFF